ncbi:hypothetical protein LGN18_04220, partial [Burkholderia vietnamiensis]|nr:hypothetical protein [Burkholderia vietnamiensis]
RYAARAPGALRARGLPGKTWLPSCSWLHSLKSWSLHKIRGGSGRLGPISDGTAQLMPKAVGTPVTLDGQSITTVGRHLMGDVTNGINQQVATDQFGLVSQMNSSH